MNWRTFIRNWLSSATSFSGARFLEVCTDQTLLFTGGGCRCSFNTKRAFLVVVRLNGKKVGKFPGNGSIHLYVPQEFKLTLQAYGVWGNTRKFIQLPVTPLSIQPVPLGLLQAEPIPRAKSVWSPKEPVPRPAKVVPVIAQHTLIIRNRTLASSRIMLEAEILHNNFENNNP